MIYQKLKDRFQLPHKIEDLILGKNNLFIDAFDKKEDLHLMPGVKDLIVDLHKNGIQLIVASSSQSAAITSARLSQTAKGAFIAIWFASSMAPSKAAPFSVRRLTPRAVMAG